MVEDVSNPGRQDEVVPSIGRSGDDDRDEDQEAEEEEEMKEVENWSPFGYRRLQDMPVRVCVVWWVIGWSYWPWTFATPHQKSN